MDAIEALRTRRSCRSYAGTEVDREAIETIVDAGRLAATARNVQPWEFVVVTDEATRRDLAELADHGPFIADAPVAIVVLAKHTKYYLEDGSAATENMLVAARALGLASCWVAGDKKPYGPDVVHRIGAPEEMKLVAMVAVGHAEGELPNPSKRPLEEVLHWERY